MKRKAGLAGSRFFFSFVASIAFCLIASQDAPANFGWVTGIAADAEGDVFIGDRTGRRVLKLTPTGEFQSVVVKGRAMDPAALTVDPHGVLYVAAPEQNAIIKSTPAGVQSQLSLGRDMDPAALAADNSGRLYIATPSGRILRYVPSTRAFEEVTHWANPSALAIDNRGNLYIGSSSGPPLMVSPDGARTNIYCGDCTSRGLAVDGDGTLYIADAYHHRVLMRKGAGDFLPAAGNGKAGLSGDGGEATLASLNFPTAIALDGAGNLLIFDYLNNVVRKVTGGVIMTLPAPGTN